MSPRIGVDLLRIVALVNLSKAWADSPAGCDYVGCGSGLALDAPWPSPRRDSSSTGWSPLIGPSAGPNVGPTLLWMNWVDVASTHGRGPVVGPVIAGPQLLFVNLWNATDSTSSVVAMNASTGSDVWTVPLMSFCPSSLSLQLGSDGLLHLPPCQYWITGVNATTGAVVADSTPTFSLGPGPFLLNSSTSLFGLGGAAYGSSTPLYQLDSESLEYITQCDIPSLYTRQVLIGASAEVVIVVGDRNGFYPPAAGLLAVNVTSCEVVWSSDVLDGVYTLAPAALTPDESTVIACQSFPVGSSLGFSASDGSLLWNTTTTCGPLPLAVSPLGFFVVAPAAQQANVSAYRWSDGSALWTTLLTRWPVAGAVIDAANTVFVIDYFKTLYALDGNTGRVVWQYPIPRVSPRATSFVVVGMAIGAAGVLYVSLSNTNDSPLGARVIAAISTNSSLAPAAASAA